MLDRLTRYLVVVNVLLTLCMAQGVYAQSNAYILDALEEVIDYKAIAARTVNDEYGKRCPLIKVYTELDRRDLRFDVDLASVIEAVHVDVPGQIWIYLSPGAKQLTVQHRKFEETIAFRGVEASKVYKTTINFSEDVAAATPVNDDGGQFFTLRVTPAVAELTVDDDAPISITNGTASLFLPYGEHTYSVSAALHQPAVGLFTLAQERVDHTVSLPPVYGYISVTSTPTAQVELNGIPVGTTPYTSQQMPFNSYTVRLFAAGYEDVTRTVTLSQPNVTVDVRETLLSTSLPVTLSTPLAGATISVNGEAKGVSNWKGSLEQGEYLLTATKEGYRESKQRVTISRTSSLDISITAPMPIYGKLIVNASQLDIEVTLDGEQLGTAPNIFSDILVGSHTVTYSGKGYTTKSEQIVIEEGKTAQTTVMLAVAEVAPAPVVKYDPDEGEIFTIVDDMPEFPGGTVELMKYISKAVKYPVIAKENRVQGRVIVTFIVNKNGKIIDAVVVRGVEDNLDKEALRVISEMPNWKPSKQRGQTVRVKYTLPVMFKL